MATEDTLITASVQRELAANGPAGHRDRVADAYFGRWGSPELTERVRNRIHWIAGQVRGETVLDIGCSEGILALLLAREGLSVTGIDINADALQHARALLANEPPEVQARVRLIEADIFTCPINQVFDTVVLGEIIEHVVTPERLLDRALACLKEGGTLVLTTPIGLSPAPDHKRSYVLSDVVALLGPRLEIKHLSVRQGYICVCGRRPAALPDSTAPQTEHLTGPESLLKLTEKALIEEQHRLWHELERRRQLLAQRNRRIEQLEQQRDGLGHELAAARQRLDQASHELQAARAVRAALQTRATRLRAVLRRRKEQARSLKAELTRLTSEISTLKSERRWLEAEQARLQAECRQLAERLGQAAAAAVAVLPASNGACTLTSEPVAVLAPVAPDKSYELCGKYLAPEKIERGDALASFCFLDEQFNPIPGNYPGMSRSARVGQFLYLPSGKAGEEFSLPFTSPARAAAVRLEFRRWNAPSVSLAPALRLMPKSPATIWGPTESTSRPQPVSVRFRSVELPERPPRFSVRMAAIMDEFTRRCFAPECHLILIRPDDWKARLQAEPPDLLFVESAWHGNDDAWQYLIRRPEPIREGPLKELVDWCRSRGIPTVFWNKEDPPHFDDFIHAARLFDYVFTTDANCVLRYQEALGHDRIGVLPFAVQPAIHNPINAQRDIVGSVCFAGAYYPRHTTRGADIDLVLRPAMKHGLTIFDRNYGQPYADRYRFPEEYQPAIRGSLPYAQMLDAYKRYRVFLNVNSVKDSPTMFSRRVLELIACGTPVISTYALGIEQMLGRESVVLVESEEEAARWLDVLLRNPDLAARMVLRGQRRIFREHTCEQRLRAVMATIGRPLPENPRRVSVVTCTNRPGMLENAIANYCRQTWPHKEFILVLNSDEFSLEQVRQRLAEIPEARVIQLPESCTLGECLNRSIEESQYEYWTKFDDDNYYAPEFLTDLMLAFSYADCNLVGKYSFYAHLEGSRCLALRYPGVEHRYASFLAGSAMVVKREVFETVRFPDQNLGEDTVFLKACTAGGFRMYAADRFNYIVRRSARLEDHTWKIRDEEFLRACQIVAFGDDFREHVTV